jgi:hypothetical protein
MSINIDVVKIYLLDIYKYIFINIILLKHKFLISYRV